ncbi:helix-turn-helix domain-containing protein [Endozoicomonas sp. SCSIO W0465]|uniref:helix-turn-helix domain-containing protein n=1 Tax=Endozoicomonas sp. SCSIO W0465 TaxID=2918516 RepID=UPI0020758B9A|nr:helix-turn-helix transcriptional regulator [Endozoicomonas sp. SCSIO W0465]USE36002.1 helix-turn-helix domain-containing protein [Endozoicomonas sp. SCSIO W0465]
MHVTIHWSERARQKASELGIRDLEIASRSGWSKSSVSLWMNGQREPKLEQKMAVAEVLGVSVHWLDTGEEALEDHKLPVITMDDIEKFWAEIEEKGKVYQETSGIRIIESCSENSFLVIMDNDTMIDLTNAEKKHIPEGSSVQIDVDTMPQSGDILLVQHNNRMVLREWKRLSATEHYLRVINRLYSNLDFTHEGDIMEIFKGTAVGYSLSLR